MLCGIFIEGRDLQYLGRGLSEQQPGASGLGDSGTSEGLEGEQEVPREGGDHRQDAGLDGRRGQGGKLGDRAEGRGEEPDLRASAYRQIVRQRGRFLTVGADVRQHLRPPLKMISLFQYNHIPSFQMGYV